MIVHDRTQMKIEKLPKFINPSAKKSKDNLFDEICEQHQRRRISPTRFYFVLALANLCCIIALFHGIAQNRGKKFVRTKNTSSISFIDITDEESGLIHCGLKETSPLEPFANPSRDSICEFFAFHQAFVGYLSWVLPLSPVICTLTVRWFLKMPIHENIRRIIFYFCLMVWRTLFLYSLFDTLENTVQSYPSNDCWYSAFRPCQQKFDFSDHVVLFMTHFVAILSLEIIANLQTIQLERFDQISSILSISYFFSIIISFLFICIGLYVIFHTSIFWHSRSETIVAWIIVIAFVQCPLYLMHRYGYTSYFGFTIDYKKDN